MLLRDLVLELLGLAPGLVGGLVAVGNVARVGLGGRLVGLVGGGTLDLLLLLRERSVGVTRTGDVGGVSLGGAGEGLGGALGLLAVFQALLPGLESLSLCVLLRLLGLVVGLAGGADVSVRVGDPE